MVLAHDHSISPRFSRQLKELEKKTCQHACNMMVSCWYHHLEWKFAGRSVIFLVTDVLELVLRLFDWNFDFFIFYFRYFGPYSWIWNLALFGRMFLVQVGPADFLIYFISYFIICLFIYFFVHLGMFSFGLRRFIFCFWTIEGWLVVVCLV